MSCFNQTDCSIGYGVVATRDFEKGDFILEYTGERIDENVASEREETGNCYIFGYRYNDKFQWYVKIFYVHVI